MLRRVMIKDVRTVAEGIKAFYFEEGLKFIPGQFIMLWLPGIGEKPFSLAGDNAIIVKKVGPFTSTLFNIRAGDYVWIRGPYGNGFRPRGEKIALVAGGIGIPPLYALAKLWRDKFDRITLIYGARTEKEVALLDVKKYVDEVIITTDDGSSGRKGFPTDVLKARKKEFDYVYACGPEAMLKSVLEVMEYRNVQISAERYMRCGIGVCGSCALGKYLVCRDGPVFEGRKLVGIL
ncbi:dihydroorotate dehydrogenase electron transfer subunit [Thermococcus sp.]